MDGEEEEVVRNCENQRETGTRAEPVGENGGIQEPERNLLECFSLVYNSDTYMFCDVLGRNIDKCLKCCFFKWGLVFE